MIVVIVNIRVQEERVDEFIAATRINMGHSRAEPGIARFEFLRDEADPSRFVLIESYRDVDAQARHKETAHYFKWKAVADALSAEPRTRAILFEIDPAGS